MRINTFSDYIKIYEMKCSDITEEDAQVIIKYINDVYTSQKNTAINNMLSKANKKFNTEDLKLRYTKMYADLTEKEITKFNNFRNNIYSEEDKKADNDYKIRENYQTNNMQGYDILISNLIRNEKVILESAKNDILGHISTNKDIKPVKYCDLLKSDDLSNNIMRFFVNIEKYYLKGVYALNIYGDKYKIVDNINDLCLFNNMYCENSKISIKYSRFYIASESEYLKEETFANLKRYIEPATHIFTDYNDDDLYNSIVVNNSDQFKSINILNKYNIFTSTNVDKIHDLIHIESITTDYLNTISKYLMFFDIKINNENIYSLIEKIKIADLSKNNPHIMINDSIDLIGYKCIEPVKDYSFEADSIKSYDNNLSTFNSTFNSTSCDEKSLNEYYIYYNMYNYKIYFSHILIKNINPDIVNNNFKTLFDSSKSKVEGPPEISYHEFLFISKIEKKYVDYMNNNNYDDFDIEKYVYNEEINKYINRINICKIFTKVITDINQKNNNDILQYYFRNLFIITNNIENKMQFKDIYDRCILNDFLKDITYIKLSDMMKSIGLTKKRSSEGIYWYGLKLKNT